MRLIRLVAYCNACIDQANASKRLTGAAHCGAKAGSVAVDTLLAAKRITRSAHLLPHGSQGLPPAL